MVAKGLTTIDELMANMFTKLLDQQVTGSATDSATVTQHRKSKKAKKKSKKRRSVPKGTATLQAHRPLQPSHLTQTLTTTTFASSSEESLCPLPRTATTAIRSPTPKR
mmetsp:Transcript_39331/g.55329  ORF Transcript_39331/g.55329 Transcript_39331/m.55329 type:complete len:108 (-) Transcript_39331:548-871(-)